MELFRLAETTPSFAPVLWDEESEIMMSMEKHVRLYDGNERTDFDDGDLILTTHRLLWLEKSGARRAIYLHLSLVESVKFKSGFYPGVFSSPKLIVRLQPTAFPPLSLAPSPSTSVSHPVSSPSSSSSPSQDGRMVVKLSFRSRSGLDGGRDSLLAMFHRVLDLKKWAVSKSSKSASRNAQAQRSEFQARSAGIGGIMSMLERKNAQVESSLSSAFSDLDGLMRHAEDLVKLAEQVSAVDESESGDLDDLLASAGLSNPVTRTVAGDRFHRELAKQVCDFIQEPLAKSSGLMSIVDAYCLYNRVRRTDMVSPEDLEAAVALFPKLGLPLQVKTFAGSTARLLMSTSFDSATVSVRMRNLAEQAPSGISEVDVARDLKVGIPVAKYYLCLAEETGALCRDESMYGIVWYPNRFVVA